MNFVRWLRSLSLLSFILGATIPSAAQTIDELKRGVVKITAQTKDMSMVGTGFIVRLERDAVYVVTAAHVLGSDPQPKVEFFTKPSPVRATVVNKEGEEVTSLALLMIQGRDNVPSGITALPIATAVRLSGGEDIVVIGHPRSAGDWTVLKRSIARREGRHVKVDANVDEGSSGGPMLQNGKVVGLVAGTTKYGLAVTASSIREYLDGNRVPLEEERGTAQVTSPGGSPTTPEPRSTTQSREITDKDGAPMVLVPAGEFWMGSSDDPTAWTALPRHRVVLSTFYLDKYEITNRRFQQFVQQNSYHTTAEQTGKAWAFTIAGIAADVNGANWLRPEGRETVFDSKREEHPVVSVSWNDAQAYCRWVGKRLPTEAEFEYATRAGTETLYWWGNGSPGSLRVENLDDESLKRQYPQRKFGFSGYDDGYIRTAPVGSFEPNPFGFHDLAGNISEWTSDYYGSYENSPERNPKGPSHGDSRVNRGGSWYEHDTARSATRNFNSPSELYSNLGFRCAQDAK